MKRKLIDFDAFQKIREESLTTVQNELQEAAPLLATALGMDDLALESYGPDSVMFGSSDGNFVKANYEVGGGYVKFEDIEQLVLNEESEANSSREVLSRMLDSLIENDENKAEALFSEWMGLPRTRRMLAENVKGKKQDPSVVKKRAKARRVNNMKRTPAERKMRKAARGKLNVGSNERRVPVRKSVGGKVKVTGWKKVQKNRWSTKKNMKEWAVIAENVIGFVDLQVNGPELDRVQTLRRDGDVVAVKVPSLALRNEAKILKFDWKTMNTDVAIKRKESKKIQENDEFIKAANELRRLNALSDSKEFETSLENAVTAFPGVIYLTEGELARGVKAALEAAGASNFDDETCAFISEGILRTAHATMVDAAAKIVRLAGARIDERSEDKYASFRGVADEFYKRLDETVALEMQAYVDVYEALRQVHEAAKEEGNEELANETAIHLDELLPIVSGEADQDLDALADAAEWLDDVVEATQPDDWRPDTPHVTHDGEHPVLARKGRHYQSPAEMQGSTPEYHHTSSGKGEDREAAKELGEEGWTNIGGEGVYPSLENPYVPKSGTPSIKGERDVDSDSGQLAHWGNDETWPSLQNPYSKPSVTPRSVKE